ncbi:MAG: Gfo/Idh/MocA family oxidoreductase [Clostridiales Family XIII bacterium]|nr:Gfo/Idh/MocA family oxidoreductase [Clostridiales Family XIII bacterium]
MFGGERAVKNSVRWGMVGGGKGSNIGAIHRSAALRDLNFELLAGAFDINPERGKEFGIEIGIAEERCYPDYGTLFAEEIKRPDGIQAVTIATPNATHYTITKAALEAGLHVVCEKPMCFTVEEADELVRIADEKGLIIGVTYGYAGHQLIDEARRLVAEGALGEIRILNAKFSHGGNSTAVEKEVPSQAWRLDPKKAGPSFVLGDLGTHAYYLLETIVPNVKAEKVLCFMQYFVEDRVLEDNAQVLIQYDTGAVGNLWISAVNAGQTHGLGFRIVGEKASIEWAADAPNYLKFEENGKPFQIYERGGSYIHEEAKFMDRVAGGHAEGLFESWSNIYRQFAIVMELASEGKYEETKNIWYPNAKEGREGVNFVDKAVASGKAGATWVTL